MKETEVKKEENIRGNQQTTGAEREKGRKTD